ncbi:MAG TPA: ABC transporter substrate-binding protein, partial [Spirochaetaceae bacterium]|nr:ABC transporter substrate-binding protein [Spirochaetaceae bacterium]
TDIVLTTEGQDERLKASHELQRYHASIVAQVPLYVPDMVIAYRKGLKGVVLYGGGQHDWSKAYVEL